MAFLKLIRFPNLVIVILTQYLLQYLILVPALQEASLSPILDSFHFSILVLSTVFIAAGGYIINDLEDYEIDLLNKPDRVIINKNISAVNANRIYWGITLGGFIISLYLAFYVNYVSLVFIYPIAVLLLYLYSKSLKKSVLWGNIIVSIFCAFVAGIVLFAERENVIVLLENPSKENIPVVFIFGFYLLFAFFSTMFREIIKDIEDVDGDKEIGCRTLPIVMGIATAKWVAIFFGIIFLGILIYWIYHWMELGWNAGIIYMIIGIIIPTIYSIFKLKFASTKKEFHQLSQVAKYIMLSGILYLLVMQLG